MPRVIRYQAQGILVKLTYDLVGCLLKFGSGEHPQGRGLVEKEIRGASREFGQGQNLCHTSGSVLGRQQLRTECLTDYP